MFTEETILASPNMAVVSTLSVGAILTYFKLATCRRPSPDGHSRCNYVDLLASHHPMPECRTAIPRPGDADQWWRSNRGNLSGMSVIDIVGGIYREECAFHTGDQLYGLAGRATSALTGHVSRINLHSALANEELVTANAIFTSEEINLRITPRRQSIGFGISALPFGAKDQTGTECSASEHALFRAT